MSSWPTIRSNPFSVLKSDEGVKISKSLDQAVLSPALGLGIYLALIQDIASNDHIPLSEQDLDKDTSQESKLQTSKGKRFDDAQYLFL